MSIRPPNIIDTFQHSAEFYGYEVTFTDSSYCDMVVFDLDRCDHYYNFNPVFLVPNSDWQTIRSRNIPVVFWHSGECWPIAISQFLNFSQDYTQGKIWYVDSNLNTETEQHLFFNSAETLNFLSLQNANVRHDYNHIKYLPYEYKFSTITARAELHKNIICNLIKHQLQGKAHFTEPQYINSRNPFIGLDDLCQTPKADPWISYKEVLDCRDRSMITVSLGSYFTNAEDDWVNFNPCYITEKVFQEAANNNVVFPVGHAGTVKYFKSLGLEFPDWIDYSYDNIRDDNQRMHAVITELRRLNTLDNLGTLANNFKKNCKNNEVIKNLSFKKDFEDIFEKINNI